MDLKEAEKEKVYIAEKQISYVRTIIIAFGSIIFFMLDEEHIIKPLAYPLFVFTWIYALFVLIYKPYKKHPVFLAGWFTYLGDGIFITLWVYATGGIFSPFHLIYYTSITAVAFRFKLRTTMFTALLYGGAYFWLLLVLGQADSNLPLTIMRTGFVFILGFLTNLITTETLSAVRQKRAMQQMMEEAQENHRRLTENEHTLRLLNSELRLKNDLFNLAEENASMGSYSWNMRTTKLFYSDNLYRLLGHEPNDFEPSYEKYLSFVHPEDAEALEKMREELVNEAKVMAASTIRIIDRNGVTRHLKATARFAEEGGEKLLIGTLQDISNDVRMSRELQKKNQELEQNNKELASFSYIASHDLQEPVRKILTFTELVYQKEAERMEQPSADYLQRVMQAARRMQQLIVAFLNYSRIENSPEVQFEPTELKAVVEEAKMLLQERLDEKNGEVIYGELPVIAAAPIQLQQVFVNLIGNALKYSQPGLAPRITISAEKVMGSESNHPLANKRAKYWKISVKDNGIGFDQRYADKIFEVFQRLHSKDQYEGTGIGLAICKKVAESHQGFMLAKGELMKGAEFLIYLPVNPK